MHIPDTAASPVSAQETCDSTEIVSLCREDDMLVTLRSRMAEGAPIVFRSECGHRVSNDGARIVPESDNAIVLIAVCMAL